MRRSVSVWCAAQVPLPISVVLSGGSVGASGRRVCGCQRPVGAVTDLRFVGRVCGCRYRSPFCRAGLWVPAAGARVPLPVAVRAPFGLGSGLVRAPFGLRSGSVRAAFGLGSSERTRYQVRGRPRPTLTAMHGTMTAICERRTSSARRAWEHGRFAPVISL